MWSCYLELNKGSTLFPTPWTIWRVSARPTARVIEISSAAEWVEFASSAHRVEGGLLYPNWSLIADRWDGVHVTARAVAAIQGMIFMVDGHLIAPSYWDTEATFWLRWVFDTIEFVDEVNG